MSQLTEAELLIKHKKERRDLQSQIQSLKKTISKGDKKKKKEVTEQICRLEQELDEKQNKEIDEVNQNELTEKESASEQKRVTRQNKKEGAKLKEDDAEMKGDVELKEEDAESKEGDVEPKEEAAVKDDVELKEEGTRQKEVRVTKAQKRRNKKAAENKQREERIRVQDEENKMGPRLMESEMINNVLIELGLKIHPIPADGNCLYCSVNHQLKVTGRDDMSVQGLRQLTATYMREHKEDILPFMSHDFDEIFTEEQYEKYCRKVANTAEWGGQVEILALSNALKCPIKVIQASALATIQGEDFPGPPLVITYHRHLYRLGEHYNSTLPA